MGGGQGWIVRREDCPTLCDACHPPSPLCTLQPTAHSHTRRALSSRMAGARVAPTQPATVGRAIIAIIVACRQVLRLYAAEPKRVTHCLVVLFGRARRVRSIHDSMCVAERQASMGGVSRAKAETLRALCAENAEVGRARGAINGIYRRRMRAPCVRAVADGRQCGTEIEIKEALLAQRDSPPIKTES